MFPLYDVNPPERRPVVTWILIAINVAVFLWEVAFTANFTNGRAMAYMLLNYGSIPLLVVDGISRLDPGSLYPVFTSMFLHGGYAHIFGNMLYLYIFGDNIEDKFGRLGYIAAYLTFGVIGSLAHSFYAYLTEGVQQCTFAMVGVYSTCTPAVGASGAISGILGAYLVLFPRARVISVVIYYYIIRLVPIPAIFYLGFWFLLQFFLGSLGAGGGVAYWAHIGGFVAGVVAGLVYRTLRPIRRWGYTPHYS
jgi:membrane associated rhomboid family serine protease